MGDLSKWEAKATKINLLFPIGLLLGIIILAGVLAVLKPKPPEVQKKEKGSAAAIEEEAEDEDIDWEKF